MNRDRTLRTELLLGPEAVGRLRNATVAVAGLGAVGAIAAEALVRAGIRHLRIADFDIVRETNINRNILALGSTIGHPKTASALERLKDISPDCVIEVFPEFLDEATRPRFLSPVPDLLIDAIDSLGPKTGLLADAVRLGIPVLSSMGAGRKTDPSQIVVADISKTKVCPLAHRVREKLRRQGIKKGIICVFSTESPASVVSEPEEDTLKRGRDRRPVGSLVTITQIFGLRLAHEAIWHLVS
jgi:tRNA A37 threonylcarbamoyladenosine dehydratase